MQEIIAAAEQLGKLIGGHARTRAFLDAARAVAGDGDAQKTLREFQEHVDRVHQLEASGRPIEPDEKRRLTALQEAVASNDKLKAMLRAQADYLDMMNRVYQAIEPADDA